MLPFSVVSPSANQSSAIPAFWNFPSLSRFGYQVRRVFAPPSAMSFAPAPLKSSSATDVRYWSYDVGDEASPRNPTESSSVKLWTQRRTKDGMLVEWDPATIKLLRYT